jgi:soluble epoxide hydrolase / lipid-phosphate phosphatase
VRAHGVYHLNLPLYLLLQRHHLAYVDVNPSAAQTLLFVHGWPSLWSTWSNQILAFQENYHLLIPDLRGFGESTHPGDVEASGTMGDMVSDLICVLSNANVQSAICVG